MTIQNHRIENGSLVSEFCRVSIICGLCYFVNVNLFLSEEVQYLKRVTRKDFSFDGSFQEAIGSILAMAQCFGVMPVAGIKSNSASCLKFQWKSFRAIYCFIAILLGLIYAGITIWITFTNDIEFVRISKFGF